MILMILLVPTLLRGATDSTGSSRLFLDEARLFNPREVFNVSQDILDAPLGMVTDADIDEEGTVYLVDSTGSLIWRISRDGKALPPLGISNSGSGEFRFPQFMSVGSNGTCYVTQAMSPMIARFDPDGRPDVPIEIHDLDGAWLRGFQMRFVAFDERNIFWCVHHAVESTSQGKQGTMVATMVGVFDGITEPLIRTGEPDLDPSNVEVTDRAFRLVHDGWDIGPAGAMVRADPDGGYALTIGRPGDRNAIRLPLEEGASDSDVLAAKAASGGQEEAVADIPRIAQVRWLDRDLILVRPTAAIRRNPKGTAGVFDVVRRNGASLGRFEIVCPFDPDHDRVFLKGGHLILVKGARDIETPFDTQVLDSGVDGPDASSTVAKKGIRIICYSLSGLGTSAWK